ncbi:hypothetical protein AB0F07_33300 [Streptomyces fructofermentans]
MTTAPRRSGIPIMTERNTRALRAAIAQHAPQLFADYDRHGRGQRRAA